MKSRIALGAFVLLFLAVLTGVMIRNNRSAQAKYVMSPSPFDDANKISYRCQKDEDALSLLAQNDQIETKETSVGKLVTKINGKEQGGGKYWIFNINHQEATVGAQAYICQGAEEIEWELK